MTTDIRADDKIAVLERTVAEQRRMIDALVIAAERRTAGEPDSAAIATWRRNLTLARRVKERTERIRAAEELLRAVIDSIDSGLCIVDADGNIVDTNQMWDAMLERVHSSAARGTWLSLLAEDAPADLGHLLEEAIGAVNGVLASQPAQPTRTHRVQTRQGTRWWRMRVDPVRGHGTARAVLTLTDETEAVRIQQELRQATRDASRLALVARHMDDGVVIADAEGRIEWVNDAFTQMSGYTFAEAIGRMRTELLGIDQLPAIDMAAMSAGDSVVLPDFETRTKDGRPCWLSVELYRVDDDDGMAWLMGVERDVTARRAAERAILAAKAEAEALAQELSLEKAVLTGVISSIPHLIYWKDAHGQYAGCNAAYLSMRGLPAGTDLIGRPEDEIGVADDLTPILADLEGRALATGQLIADQHVTVAQPEGPRSLLMSVLPQPDNAGAVGGLIGIGADVTHISALERQLNQTNRLEAIGQLAAGIAHEINTPIQFVSDNTRFVEQSFAQLLTLVEGLQTRFGDSGPPLAELFPDVDVDFLVAEVPAAMTESLEGLERVAQIVRAMKDFSHPGQGRGDVDINRAVESTVQVARNEWKYHAEMDLRLADDVGLVPCYEGELKQVILNLIVNAAHAIEASGLREGGLLGHIVISTTRTADHAEITVRDDGIGMDEATRLRIFDPFFTTKEVGKGTGQGLSMAYASIVQKHGGTIGVASAPGAGTAFTLTLPTRVAVKA
jgi:two-component system NtrC family sensor kinase